ncbi:MAG: acyltransferase family protein [Pseudomonadota bacterium]
MPPERRHDIDCLRVLAFALLVYFHAAILFIPGGLPLLQNDETSSLLKVFVNFSHQFRLSLLFFVSGIGISFARRRRSDRSFLYERSIRLLVPLVFGIFAIVPPMVYIEKLALGEVPADFIAFYRAFFVSGIYPDGHLSWHHLWFVAYLYLYCLLGYRLFGWLDQPSVNKWLRTRLADGRVYQFILPLFVVELLLRHLFPGFRDLISDWASFFHWWMILLAGYVIANHEPIVDNLLSRRRESLMLAVIATVGLFAGFYGDEGFRLERSDPDVVFRYVAYCLVRMTMVWCWILAIVGYGARYLRKGSPMLTYLNEAVYPFFILHLTTTVFIGYWVISMPLGLWSKYLVITTGTIAVVLLLYHVGIRPFNSMRFLFGMKPRPRH